MGSVRSWLVLTVNSQWGWCFLSMRKELRHFLLFKQGPFFFQRTGKATRDSHSASNKPSPCVLGTWESEWRREKEEIGCYLASFNTCAHLLPGTLWFPNLLDSIPLFLLPSRPVLHLSSPHFPTIDQHPLLSSNLSQIWSHINIALVYTKWYLPVQSTPKATNRLTQSPSTLDKVNINWKSQALKPRTQLTY